MSIHVKTSSGSVCVGNNYDIQIVAMQKSISSILHTINTPSYFPKLYRALPTGYNVNELDCILASGWGLKNTPVDRGICVITFPYHSRSYSAQICIDVESEVCDAWIRTKTSDTWNPWQMISYRN